MESKDLQHISNHVLWECHEMQEKGEPGGEKLPKGDPGTRHHQVLLNLSLLKGRGLREQKGLK